MGKKIAMNFPNAKTEEWRVLSLDEQIMFMEKMLHKKYLRMTIQIKVEDEI
jgi:hypothetical protein